MSCDYPGIQAASSPPCPGRELQEGDCSDTDTLSPTSWVGELEKNLVCFKFGDLLLSSEA